MEFITHFGLVLCGFYVLIIALCYASAHDRKRQQKEKEHEEYYW